MPMRLIFDLGDKIRVSTPIWPNHKLKIQPGDLSQFAPSGNGVYGYQNQFSKNPFKAAPPQEPSGGVIYFGNNIAKTDFEAFLRLLEVKVESKDFAIFVAESERSCDDGYLVQMRIVTKFGLRFMFGAINDREYDNFTEQQLSIGGAFCEFIEKEANRWGTSFTQDEEKGLAGLFGGDGDFAREELAFGFMIENEYHGIYRIWSRAWLVTK